jgi:hypothetical protein
MFNFELFSNEEFRGSGAWSHGLDAAAVFGAPRAAEAKGLAGVLARGCSKGGGELTGGGVKGRGSQGGPYRGRERVVQ